MTTYRGNKHILLNLEDNLLVTAKFSPGDAAVKPTDRFELAERQKIVLNAKDRGMAHPGMPNQQFEQILLWRERDEELTPENKTFETYDERIEIARFESAGGGQTTSGTKRIFQDDDDQPDVELTWDRTRISIDHLWKEGMENSHVKFQFSVLLSIIKNQRVYRVGWDPDVHNLGGNK